MPFTTLLKVYLKFYFTTKRFYTVLPIYVALGLLSFFLILSNVIPRPTDIYAYTAQNYSNFVFATALVVGLFGGDAISRDFSREGLFTLTQPLNRIEIMIARYLAVFIVSAIVMLIDFYGLGLSSSYYFFGSVVPNALEIAAVGMLFLASMAAFAVLFSALFKNPMVSVIVVTIVLWLAMPSIQNILSFTKVEPWFFITYAGSVVQNLAYKVYPPHQQTITAGQISITLYNPGLFESLVIMLGYAFLSLVLASFVYGRRELREV